MAPRLEARRVSKHFPGVQALKDADLEVREGEVHVLVGENGAGKSTLVKIIAGIYTPDSGEIFLNGTQILVRDTRTANNAGIYIIHQELNLVPELSIAENIYLGRPLPRRWNGLIAWKSLHADARRTLEELHLSIDPRAPLKTLSIAQQQMVEIAKVTSERNPQVIIMDEPTAAITAQETDELFRQIARLKSRGVSIIYISHRLEEIARIAERLTVMRDGSIVATVNVRDVSRDEIIQMMVGRAVSSHFPTRPVSRGREMLRVENITRGKKPNGVSFSLYTGEVLGFAGLIGSGRTELMRAIFGADRKTAGKIYKDSKEIEIDTPADAVRHGIAFLTEDRKGTGLLLDQPVYVNMTLANVERYARFGTILHRREIHVTKHFVDSLQIKTPGYDAITRNLSGGNQQKVILACWLCREADIVILDEPTRGIDVGAKMEIYELINTLAAANKAVMLISSDLPEVIGMSDRMAVMSEGKLTGILGRDEFTQERIMQLAMKEMTESGQT